MMWIKKFKKEKVKVASKQEKEPASLIALKKCKIKDNITF